jgi:hypothetical protein
MDSDGLDANPTFVTFDIALVLLDIPSLACRVFVASPFGELHLLGRVLKWNVRH